MPQKLPHPKINRLRERFRRFFKPSPLLDAFEKMGLPIHTDTPREKARLFVQAVVNDTMACMREQRHLFGYNPTERLAALRRLGESLVEGDWCPKGLSREDVVLVGQGRIEDLIWLIDNGRSIAPLEAKIYALFQQRDSLSKLRQQPDQPHSPSRLRPRPRVRLR